MPTWPAGLPQRPDANSARRIAPPTFARTDMEAGASKQRPRFTSGPKKYTFSISALTESQLNLFESFWENDLLHGALLFDWADPFNQTAAPVRFTEPYRVSTQNGVLFSIELAIEVNP